MYCAPYFAEKNFDDSDSSDKEEQKKEREKEEEEKMDERKRTFLTRARSCCVKLIRQDRHTGIGSSREGVFSSFSWSLGIVVAIAVSVMVAAGIRLTRNRSCRVKYIRQDR